MKRKFPFNLVNLPKSKYYALLLIIPSVTAMSFALFSFSSAAHANSTYIPCLPGDPPAYCRPILPTLPPAPTPTPTQTCVPHQVLQKGDTDRSTHGNWVSALQIALNGNYQEHIFPDSPKDFQPNLHSPTGAFLAQDGNFGSDTKNAVIDFQIANNNGVKSGNPLFKGFPLLRTDGKVDHNTWLAIVGGCTYLASSK